MNRSKAHLVDAVDMKQFEEILSLKFWPQTKKKFPV